MGQKIKDMNFELFILNSAAKYQVPSEIIKAVILQESSGNPKARRFEPKLNDSSYGLMQILFSTAKFLGYTGSSEGLLDPKTNIDLGTKYLAYQIRRYGNWDDAFAAYNIGSVKRKPNGEYINQAYVDGVKSKLALIMKSLYGLTKQSEANRARNKVLQKFPQEPKLFEDKGKTILFTQKKELGSLFVLALLGLLIWSIL